MKSIQQRFASQLQTRVLEKLSRSAANSTSRQYTTAKIESKAAEYIDNSSKTARKNDNLKDKVKLQAEIEQQKIKVTQSDKEVEKLEKALKDAKIKNLQQKETLASQLENAGFKEGTVAQQLTANTVKAVNATKDKVKKSQMIQEVNKMFSGSIGMAKSAAKVGGYIGAAKGILDVAAYGNMVFNGTHLKVIERLRSENKRNRVTKDAENTLKSNNFNSANFSPNVYESITNTLGKNISLAEKNIEKTLNNIEIEMARENPSFRNLQGLGLMPFISGSLDGLFEAASPKLKKQIATPLELAITVLKTLPGTVVASTELVEDLVYQVGKGAIDITHAIQKEAKKYPGDKIPEYKLNEMLNEYTEKTANMVTQVIEENTSNMLNNNAFKSPVKQR
ncbi:MAG: hypothetical protein BGO27_02935 [Alphaproteobacteria bacterium 33-17]|nr:MAG: hypothetical protein BGO27_02935 [Alphaproteobacteria bacterium 33-17]